MVHHRGVAHTPFYQERLTPNWWTYLTTLLLIPAIVLVAAPIKPPAGLWVGIVAAIVSYVAVVWALIGLAPRLRVRDGEFSAGRATLPLAVIADVTPLHGADAERALRTDLNARAYLVIRGWARQVVRIDLADPDDPTPYWLVSTRRPDELARALRSA